MGCHALWAAIQGAGALAGLAPPPIVCEYRYLVLFIRDGLMGQDGRNEN